MLHYAREFPIVTGLILLNGIFFIWNQILPVPIVSSPHTLNAATIFSNFSHQSFIHFAFNMAVLWRIGPVIESRVSPLMFSSGIVWLWAVMVLSQWLFIPNPILGFSGILMGIIVWAGGLYRQTMPLLAKNMWYLAGINIVMGFMPGISFYGHLVGAIGGAFLMFLPSDFLRKT